MHTRQATHSNFNSTIETLIRELEQIKSSPMNIQDADSIEKLEINLHAKATKLADLIAAIVDGNGQKDRKISPIMDASLDGPDTIFGMLLYYLKKLGVAAADKLLFISDGAKWI